MDQPAIRSLIKTLAEDLAWLEGHARSQPAHIARAAELHYAAALVRNVIGPFLEGQNPQPLHVAVAGGAGTSPGTPCRAWRRGSRSGTATSQPTRT